MLKFKTQFALILALAFAAGCGSDTEQPADAGSANAEQNTDQVSAESPPAPNASPEFPSAPLIDPNTASEAALAGVPGLPAPALAALIAGRPFATPGDLNSAIGALLSDEQRGQVYRHLFVKVGLNSGAEEDYKLIPSTMSPRKLAHEFEEYRPYESIDQFRREMSKYVSDEEVAYLARFVTLD